MEKSFVIKELLTLFGVENVRSCTWTFPYAIFKIWIVADLISLQVKFT